MTTFPTSKHHPWKIINNDEIFKRTKFAMSVYKDRYIVVAGGEREGGRVRSAAIYDMQTHTHSSLPDLPQIFLARGYLGALLNNYFYIISSTDTHRLDLSSTSEWEQVHLGGIKLRSVKTVVSDGNHLFVFNEGKNRNLRYDPNSNEWTKLPPMMKPRTDFATVIFGDNIYVIGGLDDYNGRSAVYLSSVEIFHIPTQSWSEGPPLPKPSLGASGAIIDRWIVVTGGCDDNGFSFHSFIFDTLTQKWTQSDHGLSPPRVGHGCISIDEKKQIVSVGGSVGFRKIDYCPMEAIVNRKDLFTIKWDVLGKFILLRRLVDDGRAVLKPWNKNDERNKEEQVLQKIMTDLDLDMFRVILTFLI